jgi:rhodanese-related sulfurtransferase
MNRTWFLRALRQSLLLLILGGGFGWALNALSDAPLPFKRVPPPPASELWQVLTTEEARAMLESGEALFVDARDPEEYEAGHLPGAINLPAIAFGEYYAEYGDALPRDFPLAVYCQGGACDQSHEVLEHLEQLGFQHLLLYEAGWNEWSAQGLPSEP